MFDLVTKTMKLSDDPIEFKYRVDLQVTSMIRNMEVEMKIAKRKMIVHGIASPLIVASESLGLFTSGIDLFTPCCRITRNWRSDPNR